MYPFGLLAVSLSFSPPDMAGISIFKSEDVTVSPKYGVCLHWPS
jgi:hypothetical protein